jgi:radical SAM protein with 4Fe4S-binding SPASM domain
MKGNISYALELTKHCNNNCKYCYNIWKANKGYPKEELSTNQWKIIIDKVVSETNPRLLAISGGEPLLRKDIFEIISYIKKHNIQANLITNGTLLTKEIIKQCLASGIRLFELPLLSSSPKIHDELTRNPGAWKKVITSIAKIKKLNGLLSIVIIITKQNAADIKNITELAIALEADSILCNRFNVGGMGIQYKNELTPTLSDLEKAYYEINNLAKEYEISVSSGIPIPPCILDMAKYENIRISQCQIGGNNPYYAIDPAGNLRPCNHSSLILGNLLDNSVSEILKTSGFLEYITSCPKECHGCTELLNRCRGGCMASAEVYFRDYEKLDPFVLDNFKGVIDKDDKEFAAQPPPKATAGKQRKT